MTRTNSNSLLSKPLVVANIGLEEFAEILRAQSVKVVSIDWTPPAGGDPRIADLLSRLGT